MNKVNFAYIAEILWFIIAIISVITFSFEIYKYNFETAIPFIIITFVSIIMYAFRRYLRIKKTKSNNG